MEQATKTGADKHEPRMVRYRVGFAYLNLAIFSCLVFSGLVGGTAVTLVNCFLFAGLGSGRYLFSGLLFAAALVHLRGETRVTHLSRVLLVRIASALGVYFAALALLTYAPTETGLTGGIVGRVLHELLADRVGRRGAVIILSSLIFILLTVLMLSDDRILRQTVFPSIRILFQPIKDRIRRRLRFFGKRFRRKKHLQDGVEFSGPKTTVRFLDPAEPFESIGTGHVVPPDLDDSEGSDGADISDEKNDERLEDDLGEYQFRNHLPPLNLLEPEMGLINRNFDLKGTIKAITTAMDELGVPIRIESYCIGPAIIQYQVKPGYIKRQTKGGKSTGREIKVMEIARMERDLAVQLGVLNLSIQAPVPGKSYVGIDLPNPSALKVRLRPLLESEQFKKMKAPLKIALGRDITGKPVVVDLAKMPHLLIAGTTNSGKSICMRSIALCLLMNNTPEALRLIMIDPKRVELFRFNGVPHLLGSVETEFERVIAVLNWAVYEMDQRYKIFEMEGSGVRELEVYNRVVVARGGKPLPRIVIFIDELAEIMNGPDKSGEAAINRLASLARAMGIHLVLATQRPDVSVVTGDIKTNIPARIAMKVASGIDSRVILNKHGAEKLLGRGDMYFDQPGLQNIQRIQGPMLTDQEIDSVVSFWQKLYPVSEDSDGNVAPWEEMIAKQEEEETNDKQFKKAVKQVVSTGRATASYLQNSLKIGFPAAKRILSRMESMGIVGPAQTGGKPRDVIWSVGDVEFLDEKIGSNSED